MNTTTIPGFTAEASLDRISTPYRRAANGLSMADSGWIVPQRIKLRDWTCECDAATDICVCTSGGAMRVIHAALGKLKDKRCPLSCDQEETENEYATI